MQPLSKLPLGQLRATTTRRLQEFADASGEDPEAIWQTALTATSIPHAFTQSDEGEDFWQSFTELREMEAAAVSERLAPKWVR
jgi:hypothetical protein